MNNKKKNGGNGWLIVIVVIILMSLIGQFTGGGSSKEKSMKCDICRKTYTNNADMTSIATRNMCESCYDSYKLKEDAKEEIKKYNERN